MSADIGKQKAAEEALKYVERSMTLGLGTGSTAAHFVKGLGALQAQGYDLRGVPTSEATARLARDMGVDVIEPDETTKIDLAVDGADEADADLNLTKGGGGALLREKIVAGSADRFIVIADASKRAGRLGAFPLPVEIDPFSWALTVKRVRELFSKAGISNAPISLRADGGAPVRSDGGNFIIDCALGRIDDPTALESALNAIPGVLENGLFCGMADMIIYGDTDGISIVEK